MPVVQAWSVKLVKATIPPMSPSDGDTYHIGTGASSPWDTHAGEIAIWTTVGGYIYHTPRAGVTMYDETFNQTLIYDGTYWRKQSRFFTPGNSDQVITGSAAKVTVWNGTPEIEDAYTVDFGCFVAFNNDEIELDRPVQSLHIDAHFRVDCTATPAQNTCEIFLAKDTGSGYAELDGTRIKVSVLNTSSMDGDTGAIHWSGDDLDEGDKFRFEVEQTLGSGELSLMGDGCAWRALETL